MTRRKFLGSIFATPFIKNIKFGARNKNWIPKSRLQNWIPKSRLQASFFRLPYHRVNHNDMGSFLGINRLITRE